MITSIEEIIAIADAEWAAAKAETERLGPLKWELLPRDAPVELTFELLKLFTTTAERRAGDRFAAAHALRMAARGYPDDRADGPSDEEVFTAISGALQQRGADGALSEADRNDVMVYYHICHSEARMAEIIMQHRRSREVNQRKAARREARRARWLATPLTTRLQVYIAGWVGVTLILAAAVDMIEGRPVDLSYERIFRLVCIYAGIYAFSLLAVIADGIDRISKQLTEKH